MGMRFYPEDFDSPESAFASGETTPTEPEVLEESQRLAAFEEGYQAGWEDAARSFTESHQKLSADLANNLEDLSFTFHEARAHVLKAIEPVLHDVTIKLLPEIARASLPALVSEKLDALCRQCAEAPVTISVAPGARAAIAAVLPEKPGFPLEIVEEPTLAEGQAFLHLGQIEHSVDTTRAVQELTAAIHDFFSLNDERLAANE